MSKSFIVIIRRARCNEGGHGIEYSSDLIHYETRNGAISHGFCTVYSDDFNIGVIEGGKLISFDWMDKPVGESEDTLAQIAELIGTGGCSMTDITELAQRMSIERIKQIALGSTPTMGERESWQSLPCILLRNSKSPPMHFRRQGSHNLPLKRRWRRRRGWKPTGKLNAVG